MEQKRYRQVKALAVFFTAMIVAVAVARGSFLLAGAGVLTGMVVLALARTKAGIRTDERELAVQEKAARLTYALFAPIIGLTSFIMLFPTKSGLEVFSQGEWLYIESLGTVLAFLALFLIAVYAVCYHFFNRKFGGGYEE